MNKSVNPGQLALSEPVDTAQLAIDRVAKSICDDGPKSERECAAAFPRPSGNQDRKVLLVPASDAVESWLDEDSGDLFVEQSCWPDENQTLRIAAPLIPQFIDGLCDLLGIGSAGRPTR